jgi:hypothetical protein
MKSVFFTSLIIWAMMSCHEGSSACDTENLAVMETQSDSMLITKKIAGFVNWYRDNYKEVNSFRLVYTDNKGFYHVQTASCEEYLEFIASSGFMSEEYVRLWMDYFYSREKTFEEFPQYEGPPEGFDYDLVLLTQEPDLVFNHADEFKYELKELNETTAVMRFYSYHTYDVELSNINGVWFIDYISIPDYD